MTKKCSLCLAVKPLSEFHSKRAECSTCTPRAKRRERYDLDDQKYQELLANQEGRCAICNQQTALVVDHCHSTGTVRGLLCSTCNTGLGHLQDSTQLLVRAIDYLQQQHT